MASQRIGNYRIVRQLGEGGMGVVYEALHEQIRRRAAIKVLRSEYAGNPEVVKRFVAEAKAVNLIGHPNVVNIYELGQMDGGETYIIMEYLDGYRLSERIPQGPGPLSPWALQAARQIALALEASHAKGIIHRDLKPDNIIIVPDAEAQGGERVKVLDFGIAKIASSSGDEGSVSTDVRTRSGMLMGTPKYMSPEQCRGAGSVTAKTDVYALGVILYELLAGRPPFFQQHGDGPGDLLVQHMTGHPPLLQDLNPAVPPALTAIVHEMLAKRPEYRPSLKQVIAQIDEALRSTAVQGRASTTERPEPSAAVQAVDLHPSTFSSVASETWSVVRRRGRYIIGVMAVLCCAIVGYALVAAHRNRPSARPPVADTVPATHHVSAEGPTPTRRSIRWTLTTIPSRVLVLREADGSPLGETPLNYTQPAGSGSLGVVLSKKGYADKRLVLSLEGDEDRNEELVQVQRGHIGKRPAHSNQEEQQEIVPQIPEVVQPRPAEPPKPIDPKAALRAPCDDYIRLYQIQYEGFLLIYGPAGSCWKGDDALATRCSQHCRELVSK